mgnify:CR=1 FL=1
MIHREKRHQATVIDAIPEDAPLVVAITAGRKGLDLSIVEAFQRKKTLHLIVYDSCNQKSAMKDMHLLTGFSSTSLRQHQQQPSKVSSNMSRKEKKLEKRKQKAAMIARERPFAFESKKRKRAAEKKKDLESLSVPSDDLQMGDDDDDDHNNTKANDFMGDHYSDMDGHEPMSWKAGGEGAGVSSAVTTGTIQ